jgi:hypothetical protein
VTVCFGPNGADGKRGPNLSPAKLQFYVSLQDVANKRHTKGKVHVQGSASEPPIPCRPAVVTNKKPTLGPLDATFNNQGREVGDDVDYLSWLSLMSTLQESLVDNSSSTKVWEMDPNLFDG